MLEGQTRYVICISWDYLSNKFESILVYLIKFSYCVFFQFSTQSKPLYLPYHAFVAFVSAATLPLADARFSPAPYESQSGNSEQ